MRSYIFRKKISKAWIYRKFIKTNWNLFSMEVNQNKRTPDVLYM